MNLCERTVRYLLLGSLVTAASVVVAGCSETGGVSRLSLDENLVANPGAEAGSETERKLRNWETSGCLAAVEYGSDDSELTSAPTEMDSPGARHFAAGDADCAAVATGRQVVRNIGQLRTDETVQLEYSLSGWFGGVGNQRDYATFVAWFYGPNGSLLGADALGPVTPQQRSNQTTLVKRTASGLLPVKTEKIEFTLTMKRYQGGHSGYADGLSFSLTTP